MFSPTFPLSALRAAPYNPRSIDIARASELQRSLRELDVIKAVIAASDGLLLAGHQRRAQLVAMGKTTIPAIILEGAVSPLDQARFNQLHNAIDLDFAVSQICISGEMNGQGWRWIEPSRIIGQANGYANEKREICELLAKHGPWGNAIVLPDGRVLVGGLYAACCALMRLPLLVRVVPFEKESAICHFFGQSYGTFSYAPVERTPWVQSLAQMHRLRGPKIKSRTYENLVIPRLFMDGHPNGLRVLDFGAGQMDYVRHLRAQGVSIVGFEPYFRQGSSLDLAAIHRHIEELCNKLRANGLFDLVVCDSVVNSVDSQEAENDVLACLNAFCKPGGTVVWSGRNRDDQRLKSDPKRKLRTGRTTNIGFFDQNGLTALPRAQGWQFQKFHTLVDVEKQAKTFFGDHWEIYSQEGRLQRSPAKSGRSDRPAWGAVATKNRALDRAMVESALKREFDMPLPNGQSLGAERQVIAAWREAIRVTLER